MLVSNTVSDLLARERVLLADVLAFLESQGSPPETMEHARSAIANLDEVFLLVVVGEFNAGKSSFLNALLGQDVLPEGVTPTTDRIYVLTHGERGEPQATADPFVVRLKVPLENLQNIALVDTPGTNAIIRQHQTLTEGFLPRADLVLFLTSADRPFTESERQFLTLAQRWGRSVILIVNKADLLEADVQREQVRIFVQQGARGVLGLAPPVYLVSARREQRGGDEGFARLRADLEARLSDAERARLKLQSPLSVVRELLAGEERRANAARETLRQDAETLRDLEAQRERHRDTMLGELDGQLNRLNRLLSEFENRADKFIDEHLRLSKVRSLLNSRQLEDKFREEAVRDLPEAIERQFESMIDRFVEANLHFWEDVQAFLVRRAPQRDVARTRFSYDRTSLIEGIAGSAQQHLQDVTSEQLAKQLSQDAEDAMKGVIGFGAGGLTLGALTVAIVGGTLADLTGVLAGLTLTGLGLFVLPAKRLQALRQLRVKVGQLRVALEEIVRREYEHEQARADTRLGDAVKPYTRFTELETKRLQDASNRSAELRARLEALGSEVDALK
ncbi:dynamin family protein [Deinococcus yavapaiensis]|uniref:Small GTP-binding protein n=1 Tax=Deinococcus yavapaiensis KR-236 TaxID=694435 RepID=A0A318S7A0_9DEIO|nr:dynamin family protein [Deinococcus yavapaiensis]PYE54201.1 small GTP-binding protein [Deinococcus yavapaiensis KR-236]